MSFLDRIDALNDHDLSACKVFEVAGVPLGFIKRYFAEILLRWPDVFEVTDTTVRPLARWDTPESRTAAVDRVLRVLRAEGLIPGWRDEPYPVNRFFGEPAYLLMERAAVPFFGVCAYGVHLNGFVRSPTGCKMWVGRRATDKTTEPGKLDQVVAGGQPAGLNLRDNLIKECQEEAGIPAKLARQAWSTGALSYCRQTPQGVKPDVIYSFDLELPADFTPSNQDGEVASFHLLPVEQVMEIVRDSEAFKLNCALVVIDFLIRHGYITPDEPNYLALLQSRLGREQALAADVKRRGRE
ncbi:MAG: DUF4743 domain-containing protein [Gammaproteobacteria bacterium]|nr:DUF4743 domain-containing protein [Gammaproteobacteria bacterium]